MFEDKTTEFKRQYTKDLRYSILSFVNTDGGKIYIGINDDGSVFGVENPDETVLEISNMIRDNIHPDITSFIDFSIETVKDKYIVVLRVLRGVNRPYYLRAKGIRPEGVYVRVGAASVPASETAILKMIMESSGNKYENELSLNQELTFEYAREYFKRKNLSFERNQMKTLHITRGDEMYLNLGMLISDQCVPVIRMAVFQGDIKSVFKDRKDLSGSILKQMEDAFEYIDRYNRTRSEFRGLDRIDMRDYPVEAVREALLNSIVHRDYSISAPTLISIFDDRIEIINAGGLIKGMSYSDMMLGISMLRNERLANIFYRLKLIEAYGTGIMKINECYREYNEKPLIEVSDNGFKITLPNTNFRREKNMNEANVVISESKSDEILKLFAEKKRLSRKEISSYMNMSQTAVINCLNKLINDNKIVKLNGGRSTVYQLR